MSEIEKLKEQICGPKPYPHDFDTELMYRQALFNWNLHRDYFDRHAAAVIELIRERMPGAKGPIAREHRDEFMEAYGWNSYMFEMFTLLNSLKGNDKER